jgi:hypothetical protein
VQDIQEGLRKHSRHTWVALQGFTGFPDSGPPGRYLPLCFSHSASLQSPLFPSVGGGSPGPRSSCLKEAGEEAVPEGSEGE